MLDRAGRLVVEGVQAAQADTDGKAGNERNADRGFNGAFYDTILKPSADAVAPLHLKGAGKSAAIFETGNRKGGAVPADHDQFINTVAGEKR